jgi:hypothetical protein
MEWLGWLLMILELVGLGVVTILVFFVWELIESPPDD